MDEWVDCCGAGMPMHGRGLHGSLFILGELQGIEPSSLHIQHQKLRGLPAARCISSHRFADRSNSSSGASAKAINARHIVYRVADIKGGTCLAACSLAETANHCSRVQVVRRPA